VELEVPSEETNKVLNNRMVEVFGEERRLVKKETK
jgi:hypothetical protein